MKPKNKKGSALILAVAVTTLLALLGALFLLIARMDEQSTSSLQSYKALDAGVDAVIAKLATELKLDTPGVAGHEYYDYPGDRDRWLANIEPIDDSGTYKWQQISDPFNNFTSSSARQNIEPDIIGENDEIDVDGYGVPDNKNSDTADADADGDGVADSKWVELDDISSQTGDKLYAAIRVIDNTAMLNINTGYKFDPESTKKDEIDGTRQTQINLEGILNSNDDIQDLIGARVDPNGSGTTEGYYDNVIWNFAGNVSPYTPFDISDELELRYRFLLNTDFETRIDSDSMLDATFRDGTELGAVSKPFDGQANRQLVNWYDRLWLNPLAVEEEKDRRHVLTTYNLDHLIAPDGNDMERINDDPNAWNIYSRLYNSIDTGLNPTDYDDYDAKFAQLAANIQDYTDRDGDRADKIDVPIVTVVADDLGAGVEHYGVERPYMYIATISRNFQWYDPSTPADSNDDTLHSSYAFGIYKNPRKEIFDSSNNNQFRLRIVDSPDLGFETEYIITNVEFEKRGGRFYLLIFEDPNASLDDEVEYSDTPWNGATGVDPNVILRWDDNYLDPNWNQDLYIGTDYNDVKNATPNEVGIYINPSLYVGNSYDPDLDVNETYYWRLDDIDGEGNVIEGDVWEFTTWDEEPNDVVTFRTGNNLAIIDEDSELYLERYVEDKTVGGHWLEIDHLDCNEMKVNDIYFFDDDTDGIRAYFRDLRWGLAIKQIWHATGDFAGSGFLGNRGSHYFSSNTDYIQLYHTDYFNNIGDIGYMFVNDIYGSTMGPSSVESDFRIDMTDPNMQSVFKYLTRFNAEKVKGRININTAPYYVIKQLPWVSLRKDDMTEPNALAKAIVAYRDKLDSWSNYTGPYYDGANGRQAETNLNYLREDPGFDNSGELTTVMNNTGDDEFDIRYYALDSKDQIGYPDLTYYWRTGRDYAVDDLEERNLIFSRISDLVTVRSDVFTAYILVRLGTDGPQRRVIAILDRSSVTSAGGKVKIKTVYPVPDPR